MISKRDDFSQKTKEILAKRVGYICSNPDCKVSTIGPANATNEAVVYLGKAAHIYSASKNKGPRANPSLTPTERKSINNGIHLCTKCADLVDKNRGLDYPTELLLKWKKTAEDSARKRFNSFIPKQAWKALTFEALEKDYSMALSCIGLNEKNVLSCPRNNRIIELVCKKLELAYQDVLMGESGCGKSLLTYQIAYEYFKKGWEVFKFINENAAYNFHKPVPKNENIVLIVDDAQAIDKEILTEISELSSSNVLIIFNWNLSTSKGDSFVKSINSIEINCLEQVQILKEFCLKNKEKIAEKLNKIDGSIGEHIFQTAIEDKIEIASREKSPWLFNYVITDGWKIAKHDKDLLKTKDRLDVVLITVALFQLITLDKGVPKDEIIKFLKGFLVNSSWLEEAEKVIRKFCFTGEFIKLKHYEYARLVLKNFIPEKDIKVIKYFQNLCEAALQESSYSKGRSNLIGLLSFDCRGASQYLKKRGIYLKIFQDLLNKSYLYSEDIYTLTSILRADESLLELLRRNREKLEQWLEGIDVENVIAFRTLVNELYNLKYKELHVSSKTLLLLKQGISSENLLEVAKYSYLLNRLNLYLSNAHYDIFKKELRRIDFKIISEKVDLENLFYLSEIIVNSFSVDRIVSENLLQLHVPAIIEYLNTDAVEAYYGIRGIIDTCFGQVLHILGGYEKFKSKYLNKQAKEIAQGVNPKAIALKINKMTIRDADALSLLIFFLNTHNREVVNRIQKEVNFGYFKELFKHEKTMCLEHIRILSSLYQSSHRHKNIKKYLDFLFDRYDIYTPFLLSVDPQKCVKKISCMDRKTIMFDRYEHYRALGCLMYLFDRENKSRVSDKLFKSNEKFISEGIFSTAINIDNDKNKNIFYDYLFNKHRSSLKLLFENQDLIVLINKIERLVKGEENETKIAALYFRMLNEFSQGHEDKLKDIKKRHKKLLNYKEQTYDCYCHK